MATHNTAAADRDTKEARAAVMSAPTADHAATSATGSSMSASPVPAAPLAEAGEVAVAPVVAAMWTLLAATAAPCAPTNANGATTTVRRLVAAVLAEDGGHWAALPPSAPSVDDMARGTAAPHARAAADDGAAATA